MYAKTCDLAYFLDINKTTISCKYTVINQVYLNYSGALIFYYIINSLLIIIAILSDNQFINLFPVIKKWIGIGKPRINLDDGINSESGSDVIMSVSGLEMVYSDESGSDSNSRLLGSQVDLI